MAAFVQSPVPSNAKYVPHYQGEGMNEAVDEYAATVANAPRGPAAVAQNVSAAAQPRLPPPADRPGQGNVAEEMEHAFTWLSHTFQGLQRFIVDQPLLAIVVAVACAFFGVSRILPLGDLIGGVLAASFTGLVIYTARTEPTREAFFEHLRHDAFHGVGASAARNRGQPIPVRA
ncbi:MAG: hypothetical protein ACHQT8_06860 [Chlamydiales bacterium]